MVADSVVGIDYPWPCDGSRDCDRHSATLPRGQLLHPGMSQKGGKRAYSGRLGKDRSLDESQHSSA
ncbi:MAG: hypothetical protein WA231_02355, partial [Methylocella sp.]